LLFLLRQGAERGRIADGGEIRILLPVSQRRKDSLGRFGLRALRPLVDPVEVGAASPPPVCAPGLLGGIHPAASSPGRPRPCAAQQAAL
jgi:hypothetical protein